MESARLPWKSFYFGGKTMLVYPGIERDIYNKQKNEKQQPEQEEGRENRKTDCVGSSS